MRLNADEYLWRMRQGLTMTCQSTVKTPYMPVLELINVSVTSPTEVCH